MPDLGSTLSLNSSNFGAGIAEARAKLTELNTSLIENRNKMKEVSKEASELQKQEKALAEAMKDGGTKEQQEEMQKLRDRIGQVNSELGTLKTREREIQSDIRKASNELDNQKNGMNNLANAGDGVANSLKKIETGLKSVFAMAASKKLVDFFIGSNAEMEQYTTSFEVMLKDAEKAQNLMGKLTDLAAVTPMELSDVVPIGTLLMNYGVAADELIDKMTQLGDLSQGNAAKFQRVALAYGQMLAKNKVTGEELRQMTEAGVPLLQALADTLGVTTAEVQDMISKSQVGIDVLDQAIAGLTTGTGQFAGMMEKQSQTFSGMLSTLKNNIAQFGRDAGDKAFDVVKDSLSELMEMIEEWRKDGTLDEIGEDIGDVLEWIVNTIKNASVFLIENRELVLAAAKAYITFKGALAIGGTVKSTIKTIQDISSVIRDLGPATVATIGEISGLAAVVAAVGLEIGYYVDQIAGLSDEVESTQRSVRRLVDSMYDSIAENEAEMNIIKDKTAEYEKLRTSENLTVTEQERLKSLAEELQDVLGDEVSVVNSLTGEYNDLSEAIDTYIEKQMKKVRFTALEESATEAYKKIEEIKRKMKERTEEHEEYQNDLYNPNEWGRWYGFKNPLDWNGKVEETSWMNDMAAYREELAKCQEIIDAYNKALEEGAYITTEASNAVDEATRKAKELEEQIARAEERKKTIDDLTDATKNLVSEYGSLSDSMKNLQDGEAISYDKMQALINIYPELAQHIQVTADGYVVETGALGDLNTALDNSVNAQIKAENEKTQAAIRGARDRITLYENEAAAAGMGHDSERVSQIEKKIKEEEAYINELIGRIELNNTLPDYLESSKGSSSNKTGGNKEDKYSTLFSYAKTASSAFAEMKKNGELAISTVKSLIDAGYESALSYDEATGKWTISAKAYETAANKQIEEAKKAEGVTADQIKNLDALSSSLNKVTDGTYVAAKAQENLKSVSVSSTIKSMKNLAEAVAEQNKNGSLTSETAASLADSGYAVALDIGVDGRITIDKDKLKTAVEDKIDDTIRALEKELDTAEGDDARTIISKIQLLYDLKSTVGEVTSGQYGVDKKDEYDEAYKAYKNSVDNRIKELDRELKEKKKARDDTLQYIEDEIQARKRLNEDNDIQKQIDAVNAQLKYSQLDEFSRHQLERKLSSLKDQQAEMIWQRNMEDKKAAANAEYEKAEAYASEEKEKLDNAVSTVKEIMTELASGITNIMNVVNTAITNNNTTNNSTANVSFSTQNFTIEQIIKEIERYFGTAN